VENPILEILNGCMSEATRVVDAADSDEDLAKRFDIGSRDFPEIFAELVRPAEWRLVDKLEFLQNLAKKVTKLRLTEPKSWAKYLFLWLCLDQDSHSCTVEQFKSRVMSGSVGWCRAGHFYAVDIKSALRDRCTFVHRLLALVGRVIFRLEFSELQVPFDQDLWSNNGQVSGSLDLKALNKSFAARVNGLKAQKRSAKDSAATPATASNLPTRENPETSATKVNILYY